MQNHAHDEHEHYHHQESNNVVIPVERQAICPLTSDIVDTEEAEATGHMCKYGGQKYYFCCATCVQLFDKNPKKYQVQ